MKQCNKCGDVKSISQFGKNNKNLDGLCATCKLCRNKEMQEYRKTKRGRLVQAYQDQRKNSVKRGHTPPNYTLEEFVSFGINDTTFNTLYEYWSNNGYNLWDTPSPDRLEDGLPYSFDNLQFISFKENNEKAHKASANCQYTFNKEVVQLTLEGEYINTFQSIVKASEHTKRSGIYDCLSGKSKTSSGYSWVLLREYLTDLLNEIEGTINKPKGKIHHSQVSYNEDTCLVSINKL